ncbi:1-deoxy-D-xylulose-5-phosphate reductoisomerase [Yunchengibacter salinarum]|uniref:1-deoxy-D-xylulose-5-phosphate reductoisomerase n=1 Tax=Yunchengibacter salinarum TaxID=3133399 RepID=UPI0035B63D27
MKSLSVLGATGSIGKSTLDLVRHHHDRFRIGVLTANRNVDALIALAREFRPDMVAIGDESRAGALRAGLDGLGIDVAAGEEGIVAAAAHPADLTVAGILGAAGLRPVLAAIDRGGVIALANKECLVCAGELMTARVAERGATLLPVDSEHNAIFQVFEGRHPERVERITLTASGGPFRGWDRARLADVTPEQAVAHPNWDMGRKISVDSATLMNKGLEMIEAYHLFPIAAQRIDVLVHPQSVVHSLVTYCDGSVLAQMGAPDMRTPIAYCLAWPDRMATSGARLDLMQLRRLDFEPPDTDTFRCLALARAALRQGGGAPTVLNAANEIAVEGFLEGRLGFLAISDLVEETLARVDTKAPQSLDTVFALDAEARRVARACLAHHAPA